MHHGKAGRGSPLLFGCNVILEGNLIQRLGSSSGEENKQTNKQKSGAQVVMETLRKDVALGTGSSNNDC